MIKFNQSDLIAHDRKLMFKELAWRISFIIMGCLLMATILWELPL